MLDYKMIKLYGCVYVCNHDPYVNALKIQCRVEKMYHNIHTCRCYMV